MMSYLPLFGLEEKREPRFIIIPVCWEGTVSYNAGTSSGPQSLFEASSQIDLWDVEFGSLENLGISFESSDPNILQLNQEALQIKDIDKKESVQKINDLSEKVNSWVFNRYNHVSSKNNVIVLLGGEHSIALGGFQAVSQKLKGDYGVLQIDAHMDLRESFEGYNHSHASVFYNLLTSHFAPKKLVQVGIRDFCKEEQGFAKKFKDKISIFYDRYLKCGLHEGKTWNELCQEIITDLPENVYISLDIDGLSPLLCPDTGTPVPGGLDFDQFVTLLKHIAASKKIVGMDLVEVGGDVNHKQWNGNAAMRILYKMLGFAAISQKWIEEIPFQKPIS